MKLDYNTFKEQFEPIKNTFLEKETGTYLDNLLHLTNTKHFDLITENYRNRIVWTVLKGKNNYIYAVPEKVSHSRAYGFFITKKPYTQHQIENLKIVLDPGYEEIRPSDIKYLQFMKEQLQKKDIEVNNAVLNRIFNWINEKSLEAN